MQAISAGVLRYGEKLPSEAELASLMGVSVITVREALAPLRQRGLLATKRGRTGGSFITATRESAEEYNAGMLRQMPRVTLGDLGVHYEVVSAGCAEFACRRATTEELEFVKEILLAARDLPPTDWRQRITDAQLELASLSQSVRLTREHLRVQAEFTPLLSLQDASPSARLGTHDLLLEQVEATMAREVTAVREIIHTTVRASVTWLTEFRSLLVKAPDSESLRGTLGSRVDLFFDAERVRKQKD